MPIMTMSVASDPGPLCAFWGGGGGGAFFVVVQLLFWFGHSSVPLYDGFLHLFILHFFSQAQTLYDGQKHGLDQAFTCTVLTCYLTWLCWL